MSEISEIIKGSPEVVVCTVKPSSDYRYCDTKASGHTEYAEIDLDSLKTRDSDDGGDEGSVENDEPQVDANVQLKRHSLPTVLPDSAERNRDNTINYLELNFPGAERPRNQSDVSRSPRIPPRINKPQSKPGAYIELEFNGKDKKSQDGHSASDRERDTAGAGDRKSNSLPRH